MFAQARPLTDDTRPWFVTGVPGGLIVTTTADALAAVRPNAAAATMCLSPNLCMIVSLMNNLPWKNFQGVLEQITGHINKNNFFFQGLVDFLIA
jgi:hypothetical protein